MKRLRHLRSFGHIVNGLWIGLIINMSLVAVFARVRAMGPVSEIRVTTQSDAVVVFGRDAMGFLNYQVFGSWRDAESYVSQLSMKFPTLSYAEVGLDPHASLSRISPTGTSYRILWNKTLANNNAPVLHAPDAESALKFRDYIRYYHISPSPLGFSLALE